MYLNMWRTIYNESFIENVFVNIYICKQIKVDNDKLNQW